MAETLVSFLLGVGLSAAVGFRVFVPMLIMSLTSMAGWLTLSPDFAWIGTPVAALVFGAATLFEVLGYLVPWVDNLLDTIATPVATVAGVIVMASVLGDVSPVLRWSLAVIAGGGVALTVQGTTVVARALSTGTTGGLANPIVAVGEAISAVVLTVMTIVIPALVGLIVLIVVLILLRKLGPRLRARFRSV